MHIAKIAFYTGTFQHLTSDLLKLKSALKHAADKSGTKILNVTVLKGTVLRDSE
jgi:hypothetical protein